jgi:hypothetical protein
MQRAGWAGENEHCRKGFLGGSYQRGKSIRVPFGTHRRGAAAGTGGRYVRAPRDVEHRRLNPDQGTIILGVTIDPGSRTKLSDTSGSTLALDVDLLPKTDKTPGQRHRARRERYPSPSSRVGPS